MQNATDIEAATPAPAAPAPDPAPADPAPAAATPAPAAPDIYIEGGRHLSGTVSPGGAKNSALKLIAATILAPGLTRITNVPIISDVLQMGEVLRQLGAIVKFGEDDVEIDTSTLKTHETELEPAGSLRAISVLGPLLGRCHQAKVALPGGCGIGSRPLDLHFAALQYLGVKFEDDDQYVCASAPDGLTGAHVPLSFASVGATENAMMAAVLARGTTTIENAAREPEIADLANFLNSMGARISGAGSPVITIEGVADLKPPASHSTVNDRIVAGTFLAAAALCQGPVTVEPFNPDHLGHALAKLEQMGLNVDKTTTSITVWRSGPLKPVDLVTLPFPGFATDLQAPFMVLTALADGQSRVAENVFENRFQHVAELQKMGADITTEGHFAYVRGVAGLHGATVTSTDLRGGAAMVLAGLAASGQTRVTETQQIDRGYQDLVGKLRSLGASISRADAP